SLPAWTLASTVLPQIPDGEPDAPALETRAWEQRLDLAAARKRVELLRSALGLAQGTALFPGGLRVGVTEDRSTDGIRSVGPTVDIDLPIFDQGQARTASLRAQLRQAEDRLAALSVEARSQIREALAAAAGRRALAAYDRETLLPEKARIVKLTLERYNYMLTGPHDLLAAKEDLVAAERSYIETARDYWIAHALLEKAVGSLLPIPTEPDATLPPVETP
ncbi:MAG TPA: TolC family protein, partial [Candidatus Methylacidiphilales bacterium]